MSASKRGRDWLNEPSDDEGSGEEQTAPHPWGVRPWGNFHLGDEPEAEREDARAQMGLFGALEDAGVLGVLSYLDAISLARLGQTCRAMAVFCHHEPVWKDLLLQQRGGDWRWAGTFRATVTGRPEGAPIAVRGLYSDLLSKSWLCASARFNAAWLGADSIPRERASELSVADFVRRYEEPNRPVLIAGAVKEWPLYRKLQEWLDSRADTLFKVGTVRMRLDNFLHYAQEALDEDPLYLFDKHFAETCPELLSQYSVPSYFAQERDLFGLLGEEERPDYRWLIMGGPCSGSTFHIDPNGTSAWNAVLSGSKKWILAPRSVQIPGVFPNASFGEVATTMSAVEWFVDFYAHMKEQQMPVLECIQRPGDVIFVPHGWFHIVLNLESSVAVTHNYVSETNLFHVMQFLDGKPDQVSGVTESKKHGLGGLLRSALASKAPAVLQRLEEAEAKARLPSAWEAAKAGSAFSLFG